MVAHGLPVPDKWLVHQLTMFFEGETTKTGATAFAANMVLTLRFDADPTVSIPALREKDLAVLRKAQAMELIASGPLTAGKHQLESLEWAADDPRLGVLRYLVIYLPRGAHLYSLTGTHIANRFDPIRPQIIDFARAFIEENKE
jgi:hypothetical protein